MSRSRRTVLASLLVLASLVVLVLSFAGCGGKSSGPTGVATATVTGIVRDATSGTPISGASIKASAGGSVLSGQDGRFSVSVNAGQNVRLDITRSDYSLNQFVVQLSANQTQALAVNLIGAGTTSAVPVASGGKVTDASSNATLSLPANFVTNAGSVNVRVTGLDPTSDQVKALPGGLDAVDAGGHAVYLKPVSFAEYTVTDNAGNVLQFNPSAGSGANIELPIPVSLRGQPGYGNGDPIECYVYDPTDGKWKTPVPGVIGASSVDGQPAIKATIFHLSWYGGAPAASQTGCVSGTVTVDGTPTANVDIAAYPGGSTKTDAQGHYQVPAALNSTIRVDASLASGSQFRTAEGTVSTGASNAVCATLDLALGAATAGQYTITAGLSNFGGTLGDFASATIEVGSNATQTPVAGAVVQVGTGGVWQTLTNLGSGEYGLLDAELTPGDLYTMRFDFDADGTYDATGAVRMVGAPVITSPTQGQSVGKSFTAAWSDSGTLVSGYSAVYFGTLSLAGTGTQLFATSSVSKVIGDGTTDPVSHLPNPALAAGPYELDLLDGTGPPWTQLLNPSAPASNVTGTNVSGTLSSFALADTVGFTSTGAAPPVAALASGVRPAAMTSAGFTESAQAHRLRQQFDRLRAKALRMRSGAQHSRLAVRR